MQTAHVYAHTRTHTHTHKTPELICLNIPRLLIAHYSTCHRNRRKITAITPINTFPSQQSKTGQRLNSESIVVRTAVQQDKASGRWIAASVIKFGLFVHNKTWRKLSKSVLAVAEVQTMQTIRQFSRFQSNNFSQKKTKNDDRTHNRLQQQQNCKSWTLWQLCTGTEHDSYLRSWCNNSDDKHISKHSQRRIKGEGGGINIKGALHWFHIDGAPLTDPVNVKSAISQQLCLSQHDGKQRGG